MGDKKYEIVPLFNSRQGLDFDLSANLPIHLDLGSARGTFNAWELGSFTDGLGQVWVDEEHLSLIWRTDKATAAFFVGGIRDSDRQNSSGRQFVKYSAVAYRINELIQGPILDKRREYLRLSEIIGQHARDSSQAEVLRLKNAESVIDAKRRLKADRIRLYQINFDELTGSILDPVNCEFHHVRRQSAHSDLVSLIWNGLILNIDTHRLITINNLSDEDQLYDFCVGMGWSLAWHQVYKQNLNNHYFGK